MLLVVWVMLFCCWCWCYDVMMVVCRYVIVCDCCGGRGEGYRYYYSHTAGMSSITSSLRYLLLAACLSACLFAGYLLTCLLVTCIMLALFLACLVAWLLTQLPRPHFWPTHPKKSPQGSSSLRRGAPTNTWTSLHRCWPGHGRHGRNQFLPRVVSIRRISTVIEKRKGGKE